METAIGLQTTDKSDVKVVFYGTRGSSAYDSLENKIFGGNTACIVIKTKDNDVLILDAGTGLLAAEKGILESKPRTLHLALSHAHHDHIEGLGVSQLAYMPNCLELITNDTLYAALKKRYNGVNFPVCLEDMVGIPKPDSFTTRSLRKRMEIIPASPWIDFWEPVPNGMKKSRGGGCGPFSITAAEGNHPGGVLGYRIEYAKNIILYVTDHEFDYDAQRNHEPEKIQKRKKQYVQLAENADLLIADAQCTRKEYQSGAYHGWGHSYSEQIIDLAIAAGVKHLVVTHHAPRRTDEELEVMEHTARVYAQERSDILFVEFARQGRHIQFWGDEK